MTYRKPFNYARHHRRRRFGYFSILLGFAVLGGSLGAIVEGLVR